MPNIKPATGKNLERQQLDLIQDFNAKLHPHPAHPMPSTE